MSKPDPLNQKFLLSTEWIHRRRISHFVFDDETLPVFRDRPRYPDAIAREPDGFIAADLIFAGELSAMR